MAIVWWEDFEALSTANILWRLDQNVGSTAIASSAAGMTGRCLSIGSTASIAASIPLGADYVEGLFSFACAFVSGNFASQSEFFALASSGINNLTFYINTNGSLEVRRGAASLQTSAAGVIPIGKRFRIEVAFVISNTAGIVTVKIDTGSGQTQIISVTSADTDNGASTINRVRFGGGVGPSTVYDDMWFDTDKTAFRVDHTFTRLAPSADVSGVSTCSTGSDRYALIDESPGSTTDYVTFAVAGEDVYDVADLASTPASIAGVGVYYVASKPDSGTLEFRSRVKSNADYANGTTSGLSMSTLGYSDFFATDPQGGGSWTKARIDAAKLVLERIS